ncbi:protein PHYLLO, chloroplastic-like [Prosopis cineraria]|uniref:protein PHYLLO, chloroplastic-like n=1 Tax=Prosopis cineraria TaxID=364024 RepID=UPI00240FB011|nr:protein PHYLLO, chloroplastic-like [Prosopis cineraria]
MKAISGSARCISVDLPGHGKSIINAVKIAGQEPCLSLEMIAGLLHNLIQHMTPAKVTLAGYSMGARIALYMALKFGYKAKGAVLIWEPWGSSGGGNFFVRTFRLFGHFADLIILL